MSDLNLAWMQANFSKPNLTLFNIGCADITDDTFRFQAALPNAKIYSFECSDFWKHSNTAKSQEFGFEYIHKAVTYRDGQSDFYQGRYDEQSHTYNETESFASPTGDTSSEGTWAYRSTMSDPEKRGLHYKHWESPKQVESISLNTFCKERSLVPDFLHIDVEGEEYNILHVLNAEYWPTGIWLEVNPKYRYLEDQFVDFAEMEKMLGTRGYGKLFQSHSDALFVLSDYAVSDYSRPEFRHAGPLSNFEKSIQQKIWLARYNCIRDDAWPDLTTPHEFFALPESVQHECVTVFNLKPSAKIL
jgi:FkbM family methyltransferase